MTNSKTARKYQSIWDQLKQHHQAALYAPVSSHSRIINAVHKEKARDDGWRFLQSEDKKKYKLSETVTDDKITFVLVDVTTFRQDLEKL